MHVRQRLSLLFDVIIGWHPPDNVNQVQGASTTFTRRRNIEWPQIHWDGLLDWILISLILLTSTHARSAKIKPFVWCNHWMAPPDNVNQVQGASTTFTRRRNIEWPQIHWDGLLDWILISLILLTSTHARSAKIKPFVWCNHWMAPPYKVNQMQGVQLSQTSRTYNGVKYIETDSLIESSSVSYCWRPHMHVRQRLIKHRNQRQTQCEGQNSTVVRTSGASAKGKSQTTSIYWRSIYVIILLLSHAAWFETSKTGFASKTESMRKLATRKVFQIEPTNP